MILEHTFKPIYDKNRFWKLISTILDVVKSELLIY